MLQAFIVHNILLYMSKSFIVAIMFEDKIQTAKLIAGFCVNITKANGHGTCCLIII